VACGFVEPDKAEERLNGRGGILPGVSSPADDKIASALGLMRAGRFADAAVAWRGVLARDPGRWEAYGHLAQCLFDLGDMAGARVEAMRCAALHAPNPGAWGLLARVALAEGREAEAEEWLRRALGAGPPHPELCRMLAKVLRSKGDFACAAVAARRGLGVSPTDPDLHVKLAINLGALGRAEEAAGVCAAGLSVAPAYAPLAQARATILNCSAAANARDVFEAHRDFGRLLPAGPAMPHRAVRAGPVRVALVSPDLHRHSVAFFLPAILAHAPAHGIEVRCYSTSPYRDEVTAELRSLAGESRWRTIDVTQPGALVRAAAADAIDVAVDLSGLSRDHRLADFAARIAPVQATYLGYPATTGVPAMDVRLVDSLTDPPGSDALSTERLVRLDPCFLCYTPPRNPPPVAARPGGSVTFGSFNTLRKLSDFTLSLWAKVLAAASGSRLLLKSRGLDSPGVRDDLLARLDAAGVPRDRVELRGFMGDDAAHLTAYGEVDVALDPFPYHGTTTTLEAMLMGVPVVTLAGDRHASRVGVSLLTNAGHSEWVATDPARYVEIAAGLAGDGAHRAALRRSLRTQLRGSALCDVGGFGCRFAQAAIVLARR
jgi:Flp pilus assembly protein TadD